MCLCISTEHKQIQLMLKSWVTSHSSPVKKNLLIFCVFLIQNFLLYIYIFIFFLCRYIYFIYFCMYSQQYKSYTVIVSWLRQGVLYCNRVLLQMTCTSKGCSSNSAPSSVQQNILRGNSIISVNFYSKWLQRLNSAVISCAVHTCTQT